MVDGHTVTAAGALGVVEWTQLSLGYDFKFGGRDFTTHQISGRLRHTF